MVGLGQVPQLPPARGDANGRLKTYGRRAFPVAGPTVWNSLQQDELRDPACDVDSFEQFFESILFSFY